MGIAALESALKAEKRLGQIVISAAHPEHFFSFRRQLSTLIRCERQAH